MSAKRSTAILLLLSTGVLLGLGCHISPKAPSHTFSSPGVGSLPLHYRLRNSKEHDAALQRTGNPYVLEASTETRGALLYYGARHTSSADDPQIQDITKRWDTFKPTVALCEGRKRRHFFGFLVEPFAGLPEPTLVHKLARRDEIPLVSLEPEYVDEVRAMLKQASAKRIAAYFFLRVYISETGGQADDSLALDLLGKRTDVDGLRDALQGLADVDELWRAEYPESPNWRSLRSEPTQGFLGELSILSRRLRGEHMVRVLLDLLERGERVFAVVGSGHVIRQEWALRGSLGMAPAWDQP